MLVDLICKEQSRHGLSVLDKGDGLAGIQNLDDLMRIQLTPDFFEVVRGMSEFQDILRDLDISDEDQFDLFETLDVDGGGTIDLEELIQGIAKLRGDARRSDIVSVSLMVRSLQSNIEALEKLTKKQHRAQCAMLRKGSVGVGTDTSSMCTRSEADGKDAGSDRVASRQNR